MGYSRIQLCSRAKSKRDSKKAINRLRRLQERRWLRLRNLEPDRLPKKVRFWGYYN